MTHTPGPWRLTDEVQTDRGRTWGINAWEDTSGITGDARLAEVFSIVENARLVAAAPDLMEACKFSLSVHKAQGMFDASERLAIERLERAIAKASGTP